ncbi:PAS domain S-box protein [Planctomyces sp. SH-PL62]|uniref:PAS domain-containing sensor histidine kinase n=1 Tax=Planctomyces sp. SH-PL62 TaxID=1636152 RepID=UPI00078EE96B|nr:PAS domain S-box protein [Planctomyces sp. SH-PL62]AMV39039.1 Sensor protein FixL [Planctomyces sp. SH-PL62]
MASSFDAQNRDSEPGRDGGTSAGSGCAATDETLLRLHHRMLDAGPQPFATLDLERRINYSNDAFCELVGYSREELIGMPIMDLTDPAFREATARSHEEILAQGRQARVVKRYRHKDGRQVPVELLIDLTRDDDGRVIGFFAFITEIGLRIQAEEALVETERRVRAIFDGIHDAVFVHDPAGRIMDANPAASRLLGYSLDELATMDVARIDDADFARGFRDRLARVLEDGQLTCEGVYRTKSGRSIPVEITSSTIRFDEQVAVLAVIRDITDRIALDRTRRRFVEVQMKSAQALEAKNRELSQSEERYRRLTEGSLDAIVATDGGGRILLFNPSAETVFGYESRAVLGQPLDLLIPALGRGEESAGGGGFDAASIVNKTVEASGRRRDGTVFPIEISFGSVEADGRIEYVASIRDQTERQRMRAMLAHTDKLASIGLLSAGVAHEINNPLSYVANNLAVLQRDVKGMMEMLIGAEEVVAALADLRPEASARLAAISEEIDWPYIRQNLEPMIDRTLDGVRRVANIVQKMRGLARTSRPKWERASVEELIDSALEMTRGRLKRDRIAVTVSNEGVDCVDCVPSDISQVLLNLMINALQAVEAAGRGDGGRIEISARVQEDWVEIAVRDNGEGIAQEDLGRLFDPFFTTKPVGEGTGLGLAISHGIVVGHGGRIEVDSGPGKGSLFRVLLPRTVPEGPPQAP